MGSTLVIDDNMRWMEKAYCSNNGIPTKTFFEKFEKGDLYTKRKVVAICEVQCPVQDACLAYGCATKSSGIFGGEYLESGRVVRSGKMSRGYLEDSRDNIARKKIPAS